MLEHYPKEIILKDGTGVTLRPLQKEDEGPLFEMYQRLSEDDRWFLENDVSDFETVRKWVQSIDVKRLISMVAVLEGKVIAHATLIQKYCGANSHIGKIRISVDPSFRERHLGTWILLDLNNLSISIGLEILVMRLVEGWDSYVMKGVKRLDFHQEAVLKNYLKDRAGNPHNLIVMVKHLQGAWASSEDIIPAE